MGRQALVDWMIPHLLFFFQQILFSMFMSGTFPVVEPFGDSVGVLSPSMAVKW